MSRTIQDIFKQFCKERHAEDKGRNHDLLQSIYAQTEFFDITLYKLVEIPMQELSSIDESYRALFSIENLSLPFQNNFIRINESQCIFLREYAPNILTGTLYTADFLGKEISLNMTFTIRVKEDKAQIILDYFKHPMASVSFTKLMKDASSYIAEVCLTLNELSKKAVVVDKPSNPNLCEYYRRKRKPTIKIPQRPIYYILGNKNENITHKYKNIRTTGTLEYSFCFRVRGHWRHINEGTLGKDRNGIYNVKGYTWVTEYTKGEGELVKRIRVVE